MFFWKRRCGVRREEGVEWIVPFASDSLFVFSCFCVLPVSICCFFLSPLSFVDLLFVLSLLLLVLVYLLSIYLFLPSCRRGQSSRFRSLVLLRSVSYRPSTIARYTDLSDTLFQNHTNPLSSRKVADERTKGRT